ncbi:hypothetical protein KP509_14G017800 [Ceratopteris richardii]|uniref:Protein FLX-like 2 n=1 Tax=Ceratopteris richardii TaxID=49495 RepID=A0A8T2T613_CERRI|nr:hypothetical protein KP509_14G017800 [Ceratopteris richardii]KAH7414917.1 hypothetical protein KP509_14G017800 [Ceratopteris richardii]
MAGLPRLPLGAPANLLLGAGVRPQGGSLEATVALLEQRILAQHNEIQKLLSENQRLAAMHITLRQELAAVQQDLSRVQQAFSASQAEKEQQARAYSDKLAKLEVEARATEPLRVELENAKAGAHKLIALRTDLSNQVNQLTQELQKVRSEAHQFSTMKVEMEALQDEVQRARAAFEYEKKANAELLEQRVVMEKNLVSMARDIEKLRAELTSTDMRTRVGSYGGGSYGSGSYGGGPYGAAESGYPSTASYGDAYGLSQMRAYR